MTLNFFKESPRSVLGSLSSVGHPTVPTAAPGTPGTLLSPSLPPSPTLPTASAALPDVSQLLQHLWAAAAGAGGSSRAGEQLLVSCPPVNHQPQHPLLRQRRLHKPTPKGHFVSCGDRRRLGQRGTTHTAPRAFPLRLRGCPKKKFRVSF